MAETHRIDGGGATPPERGDEGTPRWVYVFGASLLVFVLGFVVLHLAGGGFRGHAP